MSKIGFLHTMRWARVVAIGACCALLSSLPQSASAQLNHGQWLQLNFTDGWNPADKNEFNVYTFHESNNNSSTANPADMIDSLGNLVPGITLTTDGWQGRNWDSASNLSPWPGDTSPTPANLAGRGDSTFRRDESINFWWDASIDTPPVVTVHGLNPDLVYNVYYYSKHSGPVGGGESHTLDVNGILQTTLPRGDRYLDVDEDLFFSQVPVGLDGNLTFTWGADPNSPAGYNPVLNAIVIQAVVPEPATIGLIVGAVTLLGVVKLRRKR